MIDLLLFIFATLVALFLFDQYIRETVEKSQQRSYVYSDVKKNENYYKTSIFAVLGFSRVDVKSFMAFRDQFHSYAQVSSAMRQAGLDKVRLIVGIDFTASNEWQGRNSFRGECLHALRGSAIYNPYQKVLSILGKTLQPLLQGFPIPAFGFGDIHTKNVNVFPLKSTGAPCIDFIDLLHAYNHTAQRIQLSGPTSLAPVVYRSIDIVRQSRAFHIILIVTDGRLSEDDSASKRALVEASRNALSVVAIGVGDGPWHVMEEYDDQLPDRIFDNFQFVSFQEVLKSSKSPDAALALHALMEIPDQYSAVRTLGFLEKPQNKENWQIS
ncbi:uncharacterized protein LOC143255524 [Tachypleus tridentatus]|uniref:uncharacterized protein LOC143255524 n=1 Tax=Tachypleus tridentatus TaxID=6853 RepID=UPI003FCF2C16